MCFLVNIFVCVVFFLLLLRSVVFLGTNTTSNFKRVNNMNNQDFMTELSVKEMRETQGGFWQGVVGALLGGMLYDLVAHPNTTSQSFKKGMHDADRNWR